MRIVVLPKQKAIEFKCDEPWAAISITNKGAEYPQLQEENRVGLLQLDFDDTNARRSGCFTSEHAKKIVAFIQEKAYNIDTLLIHCNMGASRSPAVAAALYKLLTNNDDSYYFQVYTPNTLVYGVILETAIIDLGIALAN